MIEILPPNKPVRSNIIVPGSKSYTNRALLLAALAKGKSKIVNALESDDTKVMITALKKLGVKIRTTKDSIEVQGVNGKFQKPKSPIYLENAGTAVRFLTATMAVMDFPSTITGNKRMKERPIKDLIRALTKLGAKITTNKGCPPVKIKGSIAGGNTEISGSISSQYLSALIMAAPIAKNPVKISIKGRITSYPYIQMTMETMKAFGVKIGKNFKITPTAYKACTYKVEGDASSATYPLAIAALTGGKVTIKNLGEDSAQADIKFIEILKKMGCKVTKTVHSITVVGPKSLKPLGTINLNELPDAAMTVSILTAFAKGCSTLTDIGNLRVKETDRLKALATELAKIGLKVKEGKNSLTINGNPEELHAAIIETYNDHRMAMCFAVAGSKIPGIRIKNPECVSKTYPDFWKDLTKLGIKWVKTVKSPSTQKNIILGGLRGTGKSAIGKKLAKKLNYKFVDTDELIEKEQKMKIAKIVKEKGWQYFRKQEAIMAKKLGTAKKTIIATGGGMFLNLQNIKNLKKNGYIILLNATPGILAKRIKGDSNRPKLTKQKSLTKEMSQLWEDRRKNFFLAADLVTDVSAQTNSLKKDSNLKANQIESILKQNSLI